MTNISFENANEWIKANYWRAFVVVLIIYVLVRKFIWKRKGVNAKKPILI